MARLPNPKRNGRHNGIWGSYLRRLEKVTSGKSMRSPYCHNCNSHSPEEVGKGKVVITRRTKTTRTAIDPVCEMKVDLSKIPVVTTFKGNKYYFCSKDCRNEFNEHPRKFLASGIARPAGVWGRYLQRLEKVTGGRPLKCH